jgi:hypothetical protein
MTFSVASAWRAAMILSNQNSIFLIENWAILCDILALVRSADPAYMNVLDDAKSVGSPGERISQHHALAIETVEVDAYCTGSRWTAVDLDHLARIIAIIAMGQATHAARIIAELLPSQPALDHQALSANAKRRLSVTGKTDQQREVSRYHRDGLIFEAISWAAAHQMTTGKALLRDPHLSSTTQGLDGLMVQLDQSGSAIARATIFEDKCSENPRAMFRDNIMPAFKAHHENKRASDLVATAAALIEKIGLDGTESTKAAARVLDKNYRAYRGSLAVTKSQDSLARRKQIFKNYEQLLDIGADQRIGAVLITSDDLRRWFEELANRAIAYVDNLGC